MKKSILAGILLPVSVFLFTFGVLSCSSSDDSGSKDDTEADSGIMDSGADTDSDTDSDSDSDSGVYDAGNHDAGWYSDECRITYCQGILYECGDCEDNDGDDVADSKDRDCLGPCDNNESGYNTMIPGGNAAGCKQDCYFDKDTGDGNDKCEWDHRCDPLEPEEVADCDYGKNCSNCDCQDWLDEQSQECLDFCLPLVPNGCDCFGCCEFEDDSEEFFFIGSPGCTVDSLENCDPCTHVESCYNECGHCEYCMGKTELPEDCNGVQECPPDSQPCGQPGDEPCPEGEYCVTGCCVSFLE